MERRPTCDVLWRRQRGSPSCDRPKPDFANGLSRLECCERTPRERPRSRAAEQRDELAAPHVWMAPAWQEEMQRAAQKSLAVMCPACSRSPDGLLALMESANRGLFFPKIISARSDDAIRTRLVW